MSESNTPGSMSKDKLIADMKRIVADADELLRATADQAGEKVAGLRTRLEANLKAAPGRLAEFAATDVNKTTQDIRDALQKISDAATQSSEAAREAAQKAEDSVKKATESGKEAAQHAAEAPQANSEFGENGVAALSLNLLSGETTPAKATKKLLLPLRKSAEQLRAMAPQFLASVGHALPRG